MLDWSFPLYRLWGIQVRIHWLFPVFVGVELIRGAIGGYFAFAVMAVVILWIHVLSHEYGHAFTARGLGAGCDMILLWPLGGAAYCGTGLTTGADMLITFMGPAVTLAWGGASGAALAALNLWSWELLNPFGAWIITPVFWQMALVYLFKLSVILAALNLLVPAFPLDGGRLLLVWLASRYGRLRGGLISTYISIPTGIAMLMWGLLGGGLFIALISLQVLFEAWQIRQMVALGSLDGHPAFPADTAWAGYDHTHGTYAGEDPERRSRKPGWFARWRQKRRAAAERRDAEQAAALKSRVDEILDKVSREGIAALTPDEKRVLDEASRKYRGE